MDTHALAGASLGSRHDFLLHPLTQPIVKITSVEDNMHMRASLVVLAGVVAVKS